MKLGVGSVTVGCTPTLLLNSIAKGIERLITRNEGERGRGVGFLLFD